MPFEWPLWLHCTHSVLPGAVIEGGQFQLNVVMPKWKQDMLRSSVMGASQDDAEPTGAGRREVSERTPKSLRSAAKRKQRGRLTGGTATDLTVTQVAIADDIYLRFLPVFS